MIIETGENFVKKYNRNQLTTIYIYYNYILQSTKLAGEFEPALSDHGGWSDDCDDGDGGAS